MKYFIETKSWNIAGDIIFPVLSEYEGKYSFVQDFQRAWTALEFNSEYDALNFVRAMYPEKIFYLGNDKSEIFSIVDDEVFEHFKIKVESYD